MRLSPTLDEILAAPKIRHQIFPVTRFSTFLAHAAVAPLPQCVIDAIHDYATQASEAGQFEHFHSDIESETRQMAADLIGATSKEIAFASSTSAALSTVATGLNWKKGDNVIVAEGDFPANLLPWLTLRHRGVEVRFIPQEETGSILPSSIAPLIDDRTRLVSLSSIHYSTGVPLDLASIGKFLHSRSVLLCVDAIQSLGAFPCRVDDYVDFLAADAHKWLLGPQGIAILFVRSDHWERLRPPLVGWKSVRSPNTYHQMSLEYADSAKRYEPGSLNVLGLAGLHAALTLLSDLGPEAIAGQILRLREAILNGLPGLGYVPVGTADPRAPTGIVSFTHDSKDVRPLPQKLMEQDIIVSLRHTGSGQPCLRVSPHCYNVDDDINTLLEHLK